MKIVFEGIWLWHHQMTLQEDPLETTRSSEYFENTEFKMMQRFQMTSCFIANFYNDIELIPRLLAGVDISIEFWWNYRAIFDLKLIWNRSDWYRGEMFRSQQFGWDCRSQSDIGFKFSSSVNTWSSCLFWSYSAGQLRDISFQKWSFNPLVFKPHCL